MGDMERGIDHGSVPAGGRRGSNRAGNPGRAGADILAYREDPAFAVARALGLSSDGPALRRTRRGRRPDGGARRSLSPRPGTDDYAGRQGMAGGAGVPEDQGPRLYLRTWTTRFLAGHAREHGPAEAHACLADLAQGTVCKILGQDKVKPHKNVIFCGTVRSRLCREDARGAVSLS
jgi:hypothetical protein